MQFFVLLGFLVFLNVTLPIIDVIFRPNLPRFGLFIHRSHYYILLGMILAFCQILNMVLPPFLWFCILINILINMMLVAVYLLIDFGMLKLYSAEAEEVSRMNPNYRQQVEIVKIVQIVCNGALFLVFFMFKNDKPTDILQKSHAESIMTPRESNQFMVSANPKANENVTLT